MSVTKDFAEFQFLSCLIFLFVDMDKIELEVVV